MSRQHSRLIYSVVLLTVPTLPVPPNEGKEGDQSLGKKEDQSPEKEGNQSPKRKKWRSKLTISPKRPLTRPPPLNDNSLLLGERQAPFKQGVRVTMLPDAPPKDFVVEVAYSTCYIKDVIAESSKASNQLAAVVESSVPERRRNKPRRKSSQLEHVASSRLFKSAMEDLTQSVVKNSVSGTLARY